MSGECGGQFDCRVEMFNPVVGTVSDRESCEVRRGAGGARGRWEGWAVETGLVTAAKERGRCESFSLARREASRRSGLCMVHCSRISFSKRKEGQCTDDA